MTTQGYTSVIQSHDPNHLHQQQHPTHHPHHPHHTIAFEQAWNPYTTSVEDDWSHYASTEIPENLSDFDENVLDQLIMSPDSQMPGSTTYDSYHHSPLATAAATAAAAAAATDQILTSSSPAQSTSSTVPVCTPYPGEYDFQVTLEKQQKKTKSANWIYFQNLDKLFVKINKPCPFLFKTAKKPPLKSIIRALPVYLNPEHIQEVVSRCPTHRAARSAQESTTLAQHLILSEHQLARHMEDSYTRRLSVVIPYEDPQAGAEWVTNLYKFMCFSSCHSGYSRRPLHVIFTLECDDTVLGRQVIKVRCCASPGRDGCQEEENQLGKKPNKKRPASGSAGDDFAGLMPDLKRSKSGKASDELFTIQVRGRENYETLRHLRDSLELLEQLPPEFIAQFRQKQMEADNWYQGEEQRQQVDDKRLALASPLSSTSSLSSPTTTTVVAAAAVSQMMPVTTLAPKPPIIVAPPSAKMKRRVLTSMADSPMIISNYDYATTTTTTSATLPYPTNPPVAMYY